MQGERGDTVYGVKGQPGEQGDRGEPGSPGNDELRKKEDSTPVKGVMGPKGMKGDYGFRGRKGDMGLKGPQVIQQCCNMILRKSFPQVTKYDNELNDFHGPRVGSIRFHRNQRCEG